MDHKGVLLFPFQREMINAAIISAMKKPVIHHLTL